MGACGLYSAHGFCLSFKAGAVLECGGGGVLICQVASAAPLRFGALGEERGGRRGGRARERNAVMR